VSATPAFHADFRAMRRHPRGTVDPGLQAPGGLS
jgi:hypothetical protein